MTPYQGSHRSDTPAPQPTTYAFAPLIVLADDAIIKANVYDGDTVHTCIRDDSGAVVATMQLSVAAARTMARQLTIATCKIGVAAFEAEAARSYASMIGDDLPRTELLAQSHSEHLIATVPGEWADPWAEPVDFDTTRGGVA